MTIYNRRELNVKTGKQGFQETEKHDSSVSLGALQEDLGETDEDRNYYAEDEYDDWETPDYVTDGGPGVVPMPPGIRASMEADRALRSMSWETPQYVKDALERKKKSRLENQNSESESE